MARFLGHLCLSKCAKAFDHEHTCDTAALGARRDQPIAEEIPIVETGFLSFCRRIPKPSSASLKRLMKIARQLTYKTNSDGLPSPKKLAVVERHEACKVGVFRLIVERDHGVIEACEADISTIPTCRSSGPPASSPIPAIGGSSRHFALA